MLTQWAASLGRNLTRPDDIGAGSDQSRNVSHTELAQGSNPDTRRLAQKMPGTQPEPPRQRLSRHSTQSRKPNTDTTAPTSATASPARSVSAPDGKPGSTAGAPPPSAARLNLSHLPNLTHRCPTPMAATPRPRHHLAPPRWRRPPRIAPLRRLPTPHPAVDHRMRTMRRRAVSHWTPRWTADREMACGPYVLAAHP
jgi:hypothetical protein